MKVVITGASGFLGSNLAGKIKDTGNEVYALSRHTPNAQEAIIEFNPDVVVHCAWSGGNNYKDLTSVAQFNNISQGINLIELIGQLPTKTRFIGFGSFAEYGTMTSPVSETHQECPTNHYGLSKYTFKNYSKLLCEEAGIEWGWIRPCYVYGPGDVGTRLIPTIINKLLRNEKVILDRCEKIIDYLYVDDFVNYMYSIVTGPIDGIYNICSGRQYNLRDVVVSIGTEIDKLNLIQFNNTSIRSATSPIICGNNHKVKQQSGLITTTDLTTGLSKTINHYKKIYETANSTER